MQTRWIIVGSLFAAAIVVADQSQVRIAPQVRVAPQVPAPPPITLEESERVVPDRIVVQFSAQAAANIVDLGRANHGQTGLDPLDIVGLVHGVDSLQKQFTNATPEKAASQGLPDLSGWYVISFDPRRTNARELVHAYETNPFVLRAEPIGIHPIYASVNDPSFSDQWHLDQSNDADVDMPEAWDSETGDSSIVVAVLDTGVRYYHGDLGGSGATSLQSTAGNIWRNAAEASGASGVDDDGNGYVDDHVGWDFVSSPIYTCWSGEDCSGSDNDPRDFNGHGTHCSGIIGAINNNGYATASVGGGRGDGSFSTTGNGVNVMCLKIGHSANYFGSEYGFVNMSYAANALYYAADNGARIASCSWGSSNSGGLGAALDYFIAAGGLVFKAAGNDGSQSADYMGSRSDVISVAATDQSDRKASFSTYGDWVDISGPGVDILSSYHYHYDASSDYTASMSGTSMATPMAAAAAAMAWSANTSLSASEVWAALRDSADNIDSLNGSYAGKLGSGRINVAAAVAAAGGGGGGGGGDGGGGGGGGSASNLLLMSFRSNTAVPGVGTARNDDIVSYDPDTGEWEMYFDGSDVSFTSGSLDGFCLLDDGTLLLSKTNASSVGGITYDDSDILAFTPSSLGSSTAGSFSMYFDASDVAMTTNGEDTDGISILPDGRLAISTSGTTNVTGLSKVRDEDVMVFNASSFGSSTSGSFELYLDNSDVGLNNSSGEDIDAFHVRADGTVTFSTVGDFTVSGASGSDEDLTDFSPGSTGSSTSGSFSSFVVGVDIGIPSGEDIGGYCEVPR